MKHTIKTVYKPLQFYKNYQIIVAAIQHNCQIKSNMPFIRISTLKKSNIIDPIIKIHLVTQNSGSTCVQNCFITLHAEIILTQV